MGSIDSCSTFRGFFTCKVTPHYTYLIPKFTTHNECKIFIPLKILTFLLLNICTFCKVDEYEFNIRKRGKKSSLSNMFLLCACFRSVYFGTFFINFHFLCVSKIKIACCSKCVLMRQDIRGFIKL